MTTQTNPIPIYNPLTLIQPKPSVFTSDVAKRFIADTDVTEKSKRGYTNALHQFLTWLGDEGITTPSREDILAYKAHLKTYCKPNTITAYIVVVKKFFDWLEHSKLYTNVTHGIKGGGAVSGFLKDPLTTEQVRTLLSSIDQSKPDGLRNFNIINLMLHTALRTVELVRADASDIATKGDKHVLYIMGKGRVEKDSFVVLVDSVYDSIMDYLNRRKAQPNEPLFTSEANRSRGQRLTGMAISHIIKSALRAININSDRISAHCMRHTAITRSLLNGADVRDVQLMARHQSFATTQRYSHDLDRLNNAAEQLISY